MQDTVESQQPPAPSGVTPAKKRKTNLMILAAVMGILLSAVCCTAGVLAFLYPRLTASKTVQPGATTVIAAPTTASPTATPLPSATSLPPTATVQQPSVSYMGVSFSYDPALASGVTSETIPAQTDPNAPPWDIAPEYTLFTLTGYPLFPDAIHTPKIYVYPVDQLTAINPSAGETIIKLQDFLNRKPETLAPNETIPFLPLFNAAQMLQAGISYLTFQNGNGVRYLTQYGQALYPINNTGLFYTFQGLTSDNRYYIAAVLPASNPILPDPNTITQDDNFYNNFENYVQGIEGQLGAQPPASYTPDLALLDALVRSFQVSR
jgi:hypothetical protein